MQRKLCPIAVSSPNVSFAVHNLNKVEVEVDVDSPGLVDFAIGLLIFVLNLPDGQVFFFFGHSNYRMIVINPANQKGFWG